MSAQQPLLDIIRDYLNCLKCITSRKTVAQTRCFYHSLSSLVLDTNYLTRLELLALRLFFTHRIIPEIYSVRSTERKIRLPRLFVQKYMNTNKRRVHSCLILKYPIVLNSAKIIRNCMKNKLMFFCDSCRY